jgi:hypothetical protein
MLTQEYIAPTVLRSPKEASTRKKRRCRSAGPPENLHGIRYELPARLSDPRRGDS